MTEIPSPLIAPSLLASDFSRLGEEVTSVTKAGADWLHLDVMDGHFVPNLTFGYQVLQALRPLTPLPFDVHLMVQNPDEWIPHFAQAGADSLTVHPESTPHLHRTLQLIHSFGKKAGVALNPGTPPTVLEFVVDQVDLILVMTVNPGFGAQTFLMSQLPKIEMLHQQITQVWKRSIPLQVDGGITPQTAKLACQAGADVLVAGTAIFKTQDYTQAIKDLKNTLPDFSL